MLLCQLLNVPVQSLPITTGVSHRLHLGPMLLNQGPPLYQCNDLSESSSVLTSTVELYVDDALLHLPSTRMLFLQVHTIHPLQDTLLSVERWPDWAGRVALATQN